MLACRFIKTKITSSTSYFVPTNVINVDQVFLRESELDIADMFDDPREIALFRTGPKPLDDDAGIPLAQNASKPSGAEDDTLIKSTDLDANRIQVVPPVKRRRLTKKTHDENNTICPPPAKRYRLLTKTDANSEAAVYYAMGPQMVKKRPACAEDHSQ